jgi:hypothetical protein
VRLFPPQKATAYGQCQPDHGKGYDAVLWGLTNRRFLLTMSSCVLVGPTQYEPTFANYIRENERIEAIRRLKLSPLTIRRKGSLFPIMSVLKKNLILQRARGYCPTTRKWIGYSGNTSADSCAFVGGSSRSLGVGALCLTTFRGHTGTLQILRSIRVHSRVLLASGGRVIAPSRPYLMLFRS